MNSTTIVTILSNIWEDLLGVKEKVESRTWMKCCLLKVKLAKSN